MDNAQDNVALIAVLEAVDPAGGGVAGAGGTDGGANPPSAHRRTLICVANTHIHAKKELTDVKLWQVCVCVCVFWGGAARRPHLCMFGGAIMCCQVVVHAR
jgi:hypothetical protein